MKGIYWRPRKVSRTALVAIALASMLGLVAVEHNPFPRADSWQEEKLAAAERAAAGMDLIKQQRLARGHAINPRFDPAETGMIGQSMSLVTSVPGHLVAKQTSVNPNFAAAVVQMLREAGVKKGDCVAVGCSGSFPALNLAVYSALETMEARPLVVASVAASQFGANLPDLVWIDMERILHEQGLISFRALVASPGGYEDCAEGMCPESKQLIADAARRNGLEMLEDTELGESIDARMEVYERAAAGQPIAAYINIGGGAASVGRTEGKHMYHPGLNLTPPDGATEIDSVLTRFASEGVPVIHLVEIVQLANKFGLPVGPLVRPAVGDGGVFAHRQPHRVLAVVILVGMIGAMWLIVYTTVPARLAAWLPKHNPKPAVPPLRLAGVEEEIPKPVLGEFMV